MFIGHFRSTHAPWYQPPHVNKQRVIKKCGWSHSIANPWSACQTNWGAVGQSARLSITSLPRPPSALCPIASPWMKSRPSAVRLFLWGNVLWLHVLVPLGASVLRSHTLTQRMQDFPESGLWLTWYSPIDFLGRQTLILYPLYKDATLVDIIQWVSPGSLHCGLISHVGTVLSDHCMSNHSLHL